MTAENFAQMIIATLKAERKRLRKPRTLSLADDVFEKAQEFARTNKTTVSRVVEHLLEMLLEEKP